MDLPRSLCDVEGDKITPRQALMMVKISHSNDLVVVERTGQYYGHASPHSFCVKRLSSPTPPFDDVPPRAPPPALHVPQKAPLKTPYCLPRPPRHPRLYLLSSLHCLPLPHLLQVPPHSRAGP